MIKAVICVWCGTAVFKGARVCGGCGRSPKAHKYGVAAKKDRTYKGVVYASKLEAKRAAELDWLLPTLADGLWLRQVPVQLGLDCVWRVDFMCCERHGNNVHMLRFEEIKGKDTADYRRKLRLWRKYRLDGPPLHILRRKGSGWTTEVVE